MSNTRDENFWLAVDKILTQVDANWYVGLHTVISPTFRLRSSDKLIANRDFYTEDIVKYGYAVLGDHSTLDPNLPWDPAAPA